MPRKSSSRGTGRGRSWMRAPNFRRLPKLQRFFGGGRARGPEVGGTEVARERRGFVGNTLHHGPSTAASATLCTTDRRRLWPSWTTNVPSCGCPEEHAISAGRGLAVVASQGLAGVSFEQTNCYGITRTPHGDADLQYRLECQSVTKMKGERRLDWP